MSSNKIHALPKALHGNHTVTITGSGGNDSNVNLTLVVNPLPSPTISDNLGVLSTGTFSTYQWYYNEAPISGATSRTFTPTNIGYYNVIVTDVNGCTDTSTVPFQVTTVGINDIAFNKLSISPNPAKDLITVVLPSSGFDYEFYDVTGKLLLNNADDQDHAIVNIHPFSQGIYLLIIKTSEGQVVRKIIKE